MKSVPRNPIRISALAIGTCLLVSALSVSAQTTPLIEFNFNETGSTVNNTGTSGTNAIMINSGAVPTDFHTADGGGVSGLNGDRGFDLTSATAMGGTGPRTRIDGGGSILNGTTSITVQGWMKADSAFGSSARLLDAGGLFGLVAASGSTMQLTTSAGSVTSTTSFGAAAEVGEWIFFAVTYDGTASENNVHFYKGSLTGEVELVDSFDLGSSTFGTSTDHLVVGNWRFNAERAFDGQMDNFRIWAETSGSGGVLGLSDLEAVRLADTTNTAIPEPGAFAVLTGLAALSLVAIRRRM
jgi:hypothetical protein